MANIFYDVAPKILAQALVTLRENAVMPRLVNFDYSRDAAKQGQIIQVPIPSAMISQDVVPGAYAQTTPDLEIDTAPIPLNYWREVPFQLSDRDMMEVMDGVSSIQIAEAARAIANYVDSSLFTLAKGLYNYVGTAGTTPFTDGSGNATNLKVALDARALLNRAAAPMQDRRVVLGVDAEAAALNLPAFQQYLQSGSTDTIAEAQIGRKLGMDWYMDQNTPYFTAGNFASTTKTTAAPIATTTADLNSPALRNPRTTYSVAVDSAGNAATINVGDVFTVAGDTQTYVVTAAATSGASATASAQTATVSFSPAPKIQWSTGSVLTFKSSRNINLVFHRDTFALAVRPLADNPMQQELKASMHYTMVDPITNIPLRLELREEYKRLRWSIDCLWGVGLIRPQTGVVLAG